MEDQQMLLDKYFKEIGKCSPFLLAKHLGVKICYYDLGSKIMGMYKSTTPGTQRIYLNSSMGPEGQEQACFHLISRHLTHQGIDHVLSVEDQNGLKRTSRVMKSLTNFLKQSKILVMMVKAIL